VSSTLNPARTAPQLHRWPGVQTILGGSLVAALVVAADTYFSAQEGYLISLIDGRLALQKLLILSPFDPFTTLFNLAKLQHERAITVP